MSTETKLFPRLNPYSPDSYDYFYARLPLSYPDIHEMVDLPGIAEAEHEFGIEFQELAPGELALPSAPNRVAYVLASSVGWTCHEDGRVTTPFLQGRLGKKSRDYLLNLGRGYMKIFEEPGSHTRLNVVSSFSVPKNSLALDSLKSIRRNGAGTWGINVPKLGKAVGANFIYPDTIINGRVLTNSTSDVADNIRCETFRLAF